MADTRAKALCDDHAKVLSLTLNPKLADTRAKALCDDHAKVLSLTPRLKTLDQKSNLKRGSLHLVRGHERARPRH